MRASILQAAMAVMILLQKYVKAFTYREPGTNQTTVHIKELISRSAAARAVRRTTVLSAR